MAHWLCVWAELPTEEQKDAFQLAIFELTNDQGSPVPLSPAPTKKELEMSTLSKSGCE